MYEDEILECRRDAERYYELAKNYRIKANRWWVEADWYLQVADDYEKAAKKCEEAGRLFESARNSEKKEIVLEKILESLQLRILNDTDESKPLN